MPGVDIGGLAVWMVAFLFSATAHEAAHAYVAMRGGDPTAYHGGQVSLNPIPHIMRSPFGMIVIPFLIYSMYGYMLGWASAPYDPHWAARHPRRAALMAAAGPAANFLIFLAAIILAKIGLLFGIFQHPEYYGFGQMLAAESGMWAGAARLLSVFISLNVLLFVFNLFPFPPLDGSSVITLFMSDSQARKYTAFISQPMYSLVGILLAWRLLDFVFGHLDVFGIVFRIIHI
jgi:Zn-dependent protease